MPGIVFATFEVELQNTLNHLYEPVYKPETCVFEVLDVQQEEGLQGVRRKLIEAIDEMGRDDEVPESAKINLLFRVLRQRYIVHQSQEKAAEDLEISPRHLRRKQNEAVHALALPLWNKHLSNQSPGDDPGKAQAKNLAKQNDSENLAGVAWTDPILTEIAVLNQRSTGITTDLQKVIRRTVDMAANLLSTSSIYLEVEEIEPDLQITVHPNVLRQVLLFVIQQIIQSGYEGSVQIKARGEGDSTIITFVTCQGEKSNKLVVNQIHDLAAILGGKVEITQDEQSCNLNLVFPNTESLVVLVVDDNIEVGRLYRQFVTNTRYKIFYQSSGFELTEQIRKVKPDILVIDVLLPGLDGWDLLVQLREDQFTASLPVIVSSVMGSPDIAYSLGANAFLPKPVDRKALLQALDDVVGRLTENQTKLL